MVKEHKEEVMKKKKRRKSSRKTEVRHAGEMGQFQLQRRILSVRSQSAIIRIIIPLIIIKNALKCRTLATKMLL